MTIFWALVEKLVPLYVLILLGFISGRFIKIQKDTIARLIINIIAPVVIFTGIATTEINISTVPGHTFSDFHRFPNTTNSQKYRTHAVYFI